MSKKFTNRWLEKFAKKNGLKLRYVELKDKQDGENIIKKKECKIK